MKKKLITVLMVMLLGFASMLSNPEVAQATETQCQAGSKIPLPGAFTKIRIGDADGFGFGDGKGLTAAYGGPVNKDGEDILTTRDFLPDFNGDGKTSNRDAGDPFDNRSDEEIANTYTTGFGFTDTGSKGAEYTDLSIGKVFGYKSSSTYGNPFPGGNPKKVPYHPNFNFNFTVSKDKLPQDTPLFLNVIFGDYDVEPAEVILTSADGSTATKELTASAKGKKDGRIQAAFVPLSFGQVFSDEGNVWQGALNVEFRTPKEPYLAFDFAEIGVEQIPLVPCPSNKTPVVDKPIPDQSIKPCTDFSFTLAEGTFNDPDGDTLTYTATLDNGNPLPSWLNFDATTATFSGTPGMDEMNSLSIVVTAYDGQGEQVSDRFTLNSQSLLSSKETYTNPDNGHIYFLTKPGSWKDAQAEAQKVKGNLVTINDQAEEDWLWGTFGTGEAFWIGLNDAEKEGTFTWISGETVDYDDWHPIKPDSYYSAGEDEDYVVINWRDFRNPSSGWGDVENDGPFDGETVSGIVEIEPKNQCN